MKTTRKNLEMAAIVACGLVSAPLMLTGIPALVGVGLVVCMLPVGIGICQALCWNE